MEKWFAMKGFFKILMLSDIAKAIRLEPDDLVMVDLFCVTDEDESRIDWTKNEISKTMCEKILSDIRLFGRSVMLVRPDHTTKHLPLGSIYEVEMRVCLFLYYGSLQEHSIIDLTDEDLQYLQ